MLDIKRIREDFEGVKAAVEGKTIVKEIYVKGKIINIVVK